MQQLRRLASDISALPVELLPGGQKGFILETAMRLFAERNYAGASMRDIGTAVGLKAGSLYAHFASKEQMLACLIDIGHREHFQRIEAALAVVDSKPVTRLSAWVDAHVRFHGSYPMLATVINHELHALPAAEIAEALALRDASVASLNEVIQAGVERGVFHIDHDVWLAAAAIGAMGMRVAHWYNDEQPFDIDQIAAAYVDFALQIVGVDARVAAV